MLIVGKKAYMITPLVFIVFLLISVAFAFYTSRVDNVVSEGILISASIEKGVNEVYKEQMAKEVFIKFAAYECSKSWCCKNSTLNNNAECVSNLMSSRYGVHDWEIVFNCPNSLKFSPHLEEYNTTNINVNPGVMEVVANINTMFLNQTC